MISNEAVEAAVREVDRFVYKPPADELPSVEGHKNALMRAVLEAAAPYMLPAPEGVSEAEKALHDLCSWLDQWDRRDNDTAKNIRTVLSALSSERERAEELNVKLEDALHDYGNADSEAKRAELDVRDAEARAVQAEFLLALALECARNSADDLSMASDAMHAVREVCKGITGGNCTFIDDDAALAIHTVWERAQAAEAKVKELEAPFDWTAEDLVDLMAEAIMDAIDMDTNATDYARAALIALNKEGLLRPSDYREPDQ